MNLSASFAQENSRFRPFLTADQFEMKRGVMEQEGAVTLRAAAHLQPNPLLLLSHSGHRLTV